MTTWPPRVDELLQGVLVPQFALTIEGAPAGAALLRAVLSVSVTQVADQPASFALQVNDPELKLVDAGSGAFAEGRRIGVALGYVGRLQPLIDGEVAAVAVELSPGGGLTLTIDGFDALHAGSRGSAYREFRDGQTDADIVRQIAADMGLAAQVDATGARSDRRVQSHVSNLAYLQQLAAANDCRLWVERGTLYFKRVRSAPQVALARGRNLVSFAARLNTTGHVRTVEVRAWDAAQKQPISASASIGQSLAYTGALAATGLAQINAGDTRQVLVADGQVRTLAEAQALADARLAEQRRNLLSAEGSAIGDPDIRVGSTLLVADLGRFSGRWVVEQARHTLDAGGYRTSFEMRQAL